MSVRGEVDEYIINYFLIINILRFFRKLRNSIVRILLQFIAILL